MVARYSSIHSAATGFNRAALRAEGGCGELPRDPRRRMGSGYLCTRFTFAIPRSLSKRRERLVEVLARAEGRRQREPEKQGPRGASKRRGERFYRIVAHGGWLVRRVSCVAVTRIPGPAKKKRDSSRGMFVSATKDYLGTSNRCIFQAAVAGMLRDQHRTVAFMHVEGFQVIRGKGDYNAD